MDMSILLKAIEEQVQNNRANGGTIIMKQLLADFKKHKVKPEDVLSRPEYLTPHIICAYEKIRTEPQSGDADFLRHMIDIDELPAFGDPRLYARTENPIAYVMEFIKALEEHRYLPYAKDEKERQERIFYIQTLEIALSASSNAIQHAFMMFVAAVWRDGFYEYARKHDGDIEFGKTMVTIVDWIRGAIIFSHNKKIGKRTNRQMEGATFLMGSIEENQGGHKAHLHTCFIDLPTTLSLIYGAVEVWPEVKKKLKI